MDSDDLIRQAFAETHSGYSSDVLLVDDELRDQFVDRAIMLEAAESEETALWRLLTLRKSKNLNIPATARKKVGSHSDYRYASEIAARLIEDQYDLNLDRAFCKADARAAFDAECARMRGDAPFRLRLAALGLRKSRQLRPQITDALTREHKSVSVLNVDRVQQEPDSVPKEPGLYVFRDCSAGYLYIGEAGNLCKRVTKHVDHSDNKNLARFLWDNGYQDVSVELHSFPTWQPARQSSIRRSIEREMIQSQKPLFNVQHN
ncbi:MAG: excinuclease ABC subunit C [Phycisphaerales bacterium]